MIRIFTLCILLIIALNACSAKEPSYDDKTKVIIDTNYGKMEFVLYDDSPLHQANFVKLVEEHFYDGLLFHRVVKGFMIQGGDPSSKGNTGEGALGFKDVGYTIPAELSRNHLSISGALVAARQGVRANPERRSSGSQFFIVDGHQLSDEELDASEKQSLVAEKECIYARLYAEYKPSLDSLKQVNATEELKQLMQELEEKAKMLTDTLTPYVYTQEQRRLYKEKGGYPMIDGQYSIFGQMINGFDVLDKIAMVETDENNQPIEDIEMKITIIEPKNK